MEKPLNSNPCTVVTLLIWLLAKPKRTCSKSCLHLKDLSILKYSVPEFIESSKAMMKMIIEITDAKIEDGGSGAFYIFLKNKFKIKWFKKKKLYKYNWYLFSMCCLPLADIIYGRKSLPNLVKNR